MVRFRKRAENPSGILFANCTNNAMKWNENFIDSGEFHESTDVVIREMRSFLNESIVVLSQVGGND